MTIASASSFTHSHVILDDGTVVFKCSSDKNQWPWLALDPFDVIVVQTINYWTAVETGAARGTLDTGKWSALTRTEWTCGKQGVGHATHGLGHAFGVDGDPHYSLIFFDKSGSLVYSIRGKGVVFQNRDFESWREKAKEKTPPPFSVDEYQYASADAVGVATQREVFLSPLIKGDTPSAQALITKENGFPPAHPWLSGSGDHVNSTHLADAARQFANLLPGERSPDVVSGEMRFKRYVELGYPFQIEQVLETDSQNAVSIVVKQAERLCATVTLRYDRG
ncbi:hypothetical protein MNBD_ALPHA04-2122 [hydrothermal vent metagenome]|uniref:Uncharacterized protein n=1 Tax=hydrothermal vent metagenome TaxID=652676 RepID=A0A3B0SE32_9ZZZZ